MTPIELACCVPMCVCQPMGTIHSRSIYVNVCECISMRLKTLYYIPFEIFIFTCGFYFVKKSMHKLCVCIFIVSRHPTHTNAKSVCSGTHPSVIHKSPPSVFAMHTWSYINRCYVFAAHTTWIYVISFSILWSAPTVILLEILLLILITYKTELFFSSPYISKWNTYTQTNTLARIHTLAYAQSALLSRWCTLRHTHTEITGTFERNVDADEM